MTTISTLGEVRPEHDRPVDGERVLLHYQRSYPQPVIDVWAACTSREQLGRWLGTVAGEGADLTVDPVDGPVSGPLGVRVERCEAPHALVVRIDGRDLELRLTQVGVVTTVELIRRHLRPDEAEAIGPRWQYLLDRLGAHLESRPLPRWAGYQELAGEYR